jgi:hypothetical protein
MKKSEKVLLGVFAVTFLVIVGGGALTFGIKNYRGIVEENERLRDRLIDMNQALSKGAEWKRRHDWLEEHVPTFNSRQEAASQLLDALQKEAVKVGINISERELIDRPKAFGPDGLPVEDEGGYFDHAAVRVTLAGVSEKDLFRWFHSLQQPESFLGLSRLQINPSGQGKTVNCEVHITQFYRETSAPKFSRNR